MTGRPKSFDKDSLMNSAVKLFWKQGYQATSVRDVAAAAGLTTGTLYNEFGGKEDLYAAAVTHYVSTIIYPRVDKILLSNPDDFPQLGSKLGTDGTPSDRIHYFLSSSVHGLPKSVAHQACLLINTQMEVDLSKSKAIKQALSKGLKYIERGLTLQLNEHFKKDSNTQNVPAALVQINIFMTGLLLTAKSRQQSSELLPAIDQFMANTFHQQALQQQ